MEDTLQGLPLHSLAAASKRVKEETNKVALEHKELHAYVSKVGKSIDRNFTSEFGGTTQEDIFSGDARDLLNEAIVEHLMRQGQEETANKLIEESELSLPPNSEYAFNEINTILNAFREKNIEPALSWAVSHHEELKSMHSELEFKLHKLKFLTLLRSGFFKEALYYSRKLSAFDGHLKEIQSLMACFAFMKTGMEKSPYADLFDDSLWVETSDLLAKDACALLGLPKCSPLEVSVSVGCTALPSLLQIRQVMQQRQVEGMWSAKEELPVEIDLDNEFRFHSIFACPILRQQCGRTNPPMRLVCGHVISKDALQRLSNSNKLKCPYCPKEMDPRDAKRIYF
ncbi:E3 ubiquitin-protein ligase RMND5A-like isoform X2 [Clytia hemisphaerica]